MSMTVRELRDCLNYVCQLGQGDHEVNVRAIGLPDAPPEAKFPVTFAISDGDFTLLFTFSKVFTYPPLKVHIPKPGYETDVIQSTKLTDYGENTERRRDNEG